MAPNSIDHSPYVTTEPSERFCEHSLVNSIPFEEVKLDGNPIETAVDYPDVAADVSRQVADGSVDRGILLCCTPYILLDVIYDY